MRAFYLLLVGVLVAVAAEDASVTVDSKGHISQNSLVRQHQSADPTPDTVEITTTGEDEEYDVDHGDADGKEVENGGGKQRDLAKIANDAAKAEAKRLAPHTAGVVKTTDEEDDENEEDVVDDDDNDANDQDMIDDDNDANDRDLASDTAKAEAESLAAKAEAERLAIHTAKARKKGDNAATVKKVDEDLNGEDEDVNGEDEVPPSCDEQCQLCMDFECPAGQVRWRTWGTCCDTCVTYTKAGLKAALAVMAAMDGVHWGGKFDMPNIVNTMSSEAFTITKDFIHYHPLKSAYWAARRGACRGIQRSYRITKKDKASGDGPCQAAEALVDEAFINSGSCGA